MAGVTEVVANVPKMLIAMGGNFAILITRVAPVVPWPAIVASAVHVTKASVSKTALATNFALTLSFATAEYAELSATQLQVGVLLAKCAMNSPRTSECAWNHVMLGLIATTAKFATMVLAKQVAAETVIALMRKFALLARAGQSTTHAASHLIATWTAMVATAAFASLCARMCLTASSIPPLALTISVAHRVASVEVIAFRVKLVPRIRLVCRLAKKTTIAAIVKSVIMATVNPSAILLTTAMICLCASTMPVKPTTVPKTARCGSTAVVPVIAPLPMGDIMVPPPIVPWRETNVMSQKKPLVLTTLTTPVTPGKRNGPALGAPWHAPLPLYASALFSRRSSALQLNVAHLRYLRSNRPSLPS